MLNRCAASLIAFALASCATAPSLPAAEISAADLARRIEALASDAFEGRAPASSAGEAAADWIAEEMAHVGLEPAGENGTWFQDVPLVRSTLDVAASSLSVSTGSEQIPLTFGPDVVFWTKQVDPDVSFADSELVFVGHGVVAPEYGWNDYEGVDVRGKTVVILVNDPGYAADDGTLFNGRAMTYYGRWTYKYEEAGRQGAAAAIIVHETDPAAYGWDVVEDSWTGDQFDLVRPGGGADRVALEGWFSRAAAERLFDAAGLDFEALKAAAQRPGFRAAPMGDLRASGHVASDIEEMTSRNVAGVLPGAERPDDYLLLMAHWDHLGVRSVAPGEDGIFNGAVDNATGVAAVLEIAESLAGRGEPLARSVLVLAVTAEESGLLGSDYFGERPLVPLSNIVGGLNLDGILPTGPARDIVVVGYGASELEDVLARHAQAAGKSLTPDPSPEAGYFYRSDHVSLAKRGVPMLYPDSGENLVDGGAAAGAIAARDYRDNRYHAPTDEYDPATWRFDGMVEDLGVYRDVVAEIADSDAWPNWYEVNEFRSIRDAQRGEAE